MVNQKDLVNLYYYIYLPIYSDLVAFLADKPRQVLIEFESVAAHIIVYLEDQKSKQGKENLGKAYNHLSRICIDASKLFWIEIDKKIISQCNDKWIKKFATNIPEAKLSKLYFEFKEKARIARRLEMINIGKDSMKCIDKYGEAIKSGLKILRSFDPEKMESIRKYKIKYYIKTNLIGLIVGFILGIIASVMGSCIYNKIFNTTPTTPAPK